MAKSKILHIGVFGCRRGKTYIKALKIGKLTGARVTALCDMDESRMEACAEYCGKGRLAPKRFTDAEEFFNSGLFEAVVLCNYFSEHAKYAALALQKGIHVLSETMAAHTMADAAMLCDAAEASSAVYMMAENYPYTKSNFEIKKLYKNGKGKLGKVLYAEGEYIHNMSPEDNDAISVPNEKGEYHWRKYLPVTYYSSHSLAPLIFMTGEEPARVIGMSAKDDPKHAEEYRRLRPDAVGVMLVQTKSGAMFRINGSSYMGIKGNWYRLGCVNGGAETVRGEQAKVRVGYNSWLLPKDEPNPVIYEPAWESNGEEADACGHRGGDYWVMKYFIEACQGKRKPFPDVYTACTMSAVAILGWRSILNGNVPYDVPNFRHKKERKALYEDTASPFPPDKTI